MKTKAPIPTAISAKSVIILSILFDRKSGLAFDLYIEFGEVRV